MIYKVKQTFPFERDLFESNKEDEAVDFLDNLIFLGDGWFELWEEGYDMPIQAGGEQAFSPYHPTEFNVMNLVSLFERLLTKANRATPASKWQPVPEKLRKSN